MKQKQGILYLYKDFLPIFVVFEGFYILIACLVLPIISTTDAPGFLRCFASVFPFPACICALYTMANFRKHNSTLRQFGLTARQTVRAFYALNASALPLTALHIGVAALLCRLPKTPVDFWQMLAIPGESVAYLGKDFTIFTVLKVLLNTVCLCALGLFLGVAFCKLRKIKRLTLTVCNLVALYFVGFLSLQTTLTIGLPTDLLYALFLADFSLFPLMSLVLTRGALIFLLLCGVKYMTADLPIYAQGKSRRKKQKELHAKKKKGRGLLSVAVALTVLFFGFHFTVLSAASVTLLEGGYNYITYQYRPCKSAETLLKLQLHCVPPKYRLTIYDHLLRTYAYPGVEYDFLDTSENEALYEACFALAEEVPESVSIQKSPYANRLYFPPNALTDKNGTKHITQLDYNLYSLYCITLYQNGKVQEAKDAYFEYYEKNTSFVSYRGFVRYLLETDSVPQADKLWAKEQAYRLADDIEAHQEVYVEEIDAFERENPYNTAHLLGAEFVPKHTAKSLRELADSV
ncbi:MAG: hypothetical protein ACI4K6_01355 [Candidatus Fimenecus sp.]